MIDFMLNAPCSKTFSLEFEASAINVQGRYVHMRRTFNGDSENWDRETAFDPGNHFTR